MRCEAIGASCTRSGRFLAHCVALGRLQKQAQELIWGVCRTAPQQAVLGPWEGGRSGPIGQDFAAPGRLQKQAFSTAILGACKFIFGF